MDQISLANAFHCTEATLNANRKGLVAEHQKETLASARQNLFLSLIIYGILAGVLICASIATAFLPLLKFQPAMMQTIIPLTLFLAALILAGAATQRLLRGRDLFSRKVSTVTGMADKYIRVYKSNGVRIADVCFLKLDRSEFHLSTQEQYLAITKGARYQVYYIEDTPNKIILSIREV